MLTIHIKKNDSIPDKKKVNSSNAIFGVVPSTNIIFILHKAKTWDKSLQNKMKSLANISLIYITMLLVIN